MEFGKVADSQLLEIDFTLPPDAAITTDTLSRSVNKQPLQLYVGCASWGQKVWKGNLFPPKTKDADFLQEYVKHFNMIELNATHYRMYDAETIAKWKSKAEGNPDFKFCPKINQLISHMKRLKGADELTTSFLESMLAFGNKLGPIFLQMSDNYLPKNFAEFEHYLESLPRDVSIFTELRHREWFMDSVHRDAAFSLMQRLGIGAIITDTAGRRDVIHMALPTNSAFIRFVGNALHPTDYIRIEGWVTRIKQWAEQGLSAVYFGMHQSDEVAAPILCDYLIERLNNELNLKVQRPVFQPPTNTLF
jgi:uncharacterized protein YecE (DUF72 family)